MKVSKLSKVEQIRKALHDGYKANTSYTPFTEHFYAECTKYVNSTLARKYSHDQLDEALATINNDLNSKVKTDSNTYIFLDRLQKLALLIEAYIPDTRMNNRYCQIYSFAISQRTPKMITTYTNLELFNMICELEDIIKAWEDAQ